VVSRRNRHCTTRCPIPRSFGSEISDNLLAPVRRLGKAGHPCVSSDKEFPVAPRNRFPVPGADALTTAPDTLLQPTGGLGNTRTSAKTTAVHHENGFAAHTSICAP